MTNFLSQVNPDIPQDGEPPLGFETLLADLFANFVNLPAEAVDHEIEKAIQQVCESLGIDRSTLWQIAPGTVDNIYLTHAWNDPAVQGFNRHPESAALTDTKWVLDGAGAPPLTPMGMDGLTFFPQLLEIVRQRKAHAIPDVDLMPPEMAREKELVRRFGLRAALIVPLVSGGELIGGVSFEMHRHPRPWPTKLVQRLEVVAQAFAAMLLRRRTEVALRQSKARMDLAAAGANVGLWSVDLATNAWWVTDKSRELFGFAPDTVVTWERIMAAIEPQDRPQVQQVIDATIASGIDGAVEYRLLDPAGPGGGKVRWLMSRAHVHRDTLTGGSQFMGITADVTGRKAHEQELTVALDEVQRLRAALEQENTQLREHLRDYEGTDAIIGESAAILKTLTEAQRVAPTDSAVLISGETGTGKELLADAIHRLSPRAGHNMIKVNCAALPPSLIESELFGRERGAYTGAMTQQPGRFEAADGSTIFLDEIAELPLELQPKLLRVLQEGQFERLGSNRVRTVNVRIVAATNRDLETMVKEQRFRADLHYRLNVFPITVPPLRERREDIPLLVWKFVRHFATKMGKAIDSIPRPAMEALKHYAWPGNIRELRNLIERAVILSDGKVLRVQLPTAGALAAAAQTLVEVERQHILAVLAQTQWRISGVNGAAALLGLVPTTLHSKIKKLRILRPAERPDTHAPRTSAREPMMRQKH